MSTVAVDLIVLSRDDGPLPFAVQCGIEAQPGVQLYVHRVIGRPAPGDRHRRQTIARARNAGQRRGSSPWLMFLDDDVALAPGSIRRLVAFLQSQPSYGAVAVDYLGQSDGQLTPHVAMGATLFRRAVLQQIRFRAESERCECQCCCDDLRRLGYGICYLPRLRARHLEKGTGLFSAPGAGHILAALDRRHREKFRRQFLGSLRRAGNDERVHVIAYGFYPSEVGALAGQPGVTVRAKPDSRVMPPVRRLLDFQEVVAGLPSDAPVAYWDAADVFFQDRLAPLWETARQHPDRLLAVREPNSYPGNAAIPAWCLSIRDPDWRARAFQLLQQYPFLNSGFAAGTARALLQYLREAHRLRHGPELTGSRDWGDQMALNLYCHLDPQRWREIDEGWNYCAHDRATGEVVVRPDGRITSRRGVPIHVVHGNAHSLRKLELYGF